MIAAESYRMKLLMPDNMSERRAAMRAYGAERFLSQRAGHGRCARSGAGDGESWRRKAARSFNNPDNPYAHYTTTGPEICSKPAGASLILSPAWGRPALSPRLTLYARTIQTGDHCRPATGRGQQHSRHCRWPTEYLPGIFNASLVDEVLDIHQRDAENTMRELAVREGIFCGVSSGGAVAGALRVAKANPDAVVVAIICDRGDRYLSTGVFGEEHFSQGAGI